MKTVLIVDDEEDVLSLLKSIVESVGYKTLEASNGKQCLAKIDGADLLILDIMMPNMSGLGVLKAIKGKDIPIIVLTAMKQDQEGKETFLKLGVDVFMDKPFENEELISNIKSLLRD